MNSCRAVLMMVVAADALFDARYHASFAASPWRLDGHGAVPRMGSEMPSRYIR